MRKNFVETYRISKTFDAPLKFVFDWCTDFREDDPKMVGSKLRRTFLERTAERVVWLATYRSGGKKVEGLRVVWLRPPASWHLDTCGDKRELGDYKLTSLGKARTRLDMTFQLTYEEEKDVQPRKKWESEVLEEWRQYGSHLERDYRASLAR